MCRASSNKLNATGRDFCLIDTKKLMELPDIYSTVYKLNAVQILIHELHEFIFFPRKPVVIESIIICMKRFTFDHHAYMVFLKHFLVAYNVENFFKITCNSYLIIMAFKILGITFMKNTFETFATPKIGQMPIDKIPCYALYMLTRFKSLTIALFVFTNIVAAIY
ncbi:uncharacterized protein EV154DRAFT_476435 [Mucor mucedo]|uniref:uncharacterized protein n=1 Tax=Mucor mucedo TaxID=29922 RepID=UPI00221F187E|nr:uncharacterized protein EV154DRAFT_476435 [Mucor mucedo]KAI7896421.1 hypothetical protein EV154DRAFT_476435 [Mucor mucedo]